MISFPGLQSVKVALAALCAAAMFGAGWYTKGRVAEAEIAEVKREQAELIAAAQKAHAAELERALARSRAAEAASKEVADAARKEQERLAGARAAADRELVRLRDARLHYLAAWAARPGCPSVTPIGDVAPPDPGRVPEYDYERVVQLYDRLDGICRAAVEHSATCDAGFRAYERWVERALIPACQGD